MPEIVKRPAEKTRAFPELSKMRMPFFLPLLLLIASSAGARCPDPRPRLLCAEYFQSDVVVTATLLKTRYVSAEEDDSIFHTMRTERVWRGKIGSTFRVVDCRCSGAAGVPSEKGHRYLLFLSYKKEFRAWALDGCGYSDDLENAEETVKGIHELRSGGDGGTIHGSVWGNEEATVMAAGVTVLAKGKRGAFRAVTDKQGNFEMNVPAGVYSVTVAGQGRQFEPEIDSYEDPKKFRVSDGGCAQLQFVPVEEIRREPVRPDQSVSKNP